MGGDSGSEGGEDSGSDEEDCYSEVGGNSDSE